MSVALSTAVLPVSEETVPINRVQEFPRRVLPTRATSAAQAEASSIASRVTRFTVPDLRGWVLPLLLVAAWWMTTSAGWVNTKLIVPPAEVLNTAIKTFQDPLFYQGVVLSLGRDLAGFSVGAFAGVLLGCAMGVSRWTDRALGPTFHTLRQISLFAWLPLLSTWLGYGELSKLVFIALSTLYPVALGTFEGVRNVSQSHLEVARVYGFTPWQVFARLVLPSAAPQIATGLTLGLIYAWVATIGSEFLLANWGHGLGNLIIKARSSFNVPLIVVGMLVIGTVGTVLNRLAHRVEARALHWRVPASTH